MISKFTLDYLKKLKKNNDRDWFENNRKTYEPAKAEYFELIQQVLEGVKKFDPTVADNTTKEAMFRINRDVRFSKDKSPYKTHFGANIKRGGKKSMYAGYYIHLEPGNSFYGGGLWFPEAIDLKKIRQEIDYCYDDFKKIIEDKTFKKTYGGLEITEETSLTRPPKDYEANNPAIDFLKLKCFVATKNVTDEEVLNKNFAQQIIKDFKTLHPFLVFVNHSLEN
jgi:uncharacterized protein (TIGR02453 family)